ncbi:alpha/beta fold hydrolase [Geminocystis sp. NIES-3709]|uniref:alpha/beta fold hydrolase n=1 Tax=Geminocystis sp. NIES-3709 TaxID=1617448 RepID=UPI0005FC56B7|nr:alpha/beta hydrolase [Geminocystis sp. NIES-3709]BAQ63654.1 hydrolase of unknown specificity RsbQ [Geminocystis sp. NIES-3709]
MNELVKRHNIQILGKLDAKKTLIFSHGFGSQQSTWELILPAFEQRYRIILFDLIGSTFLGMDEFDIQHYCSFKEYAEDLIKICSFLEIKKASFIAHSASCMIGTLVAIKNPNFFKELIFIGASPRYLDDTNYVGGFTEKEVIEMLNAMTKNYYDWINHYTVKAIDDPKQPFLSQEFAQSLLKLSPDIALIVFKMIISSDYRKEVSQLKLPTLIIQPQDDMFVPLEVGFYLNKMIENSKFQILPTKGHFPHLTHPFMIAHTISRYLNRSSNKAKRI